MKLKFKKLHPEAKIPKYAKSGDAGLDLTAVSMSVGIDKVKAPGSNVYYTKEKYLEYHTGLACEIPEGYVGLLFPRSSISNTAMDLCNAVGVLDSGYRGEITFRFRNVNNGLDAYKVGDKIGQLLVVEIPRIEVEEVTELSESERNESGFGSSGR